MNERISIRKAKQKCLPWRKTTGGSGHERKSTSFVENTNLCQFRPRYWIIWIPLGIWCHINHLRSLDSHQNSLGRVKAHRQNQIIPHGWQDATNGKAKPRNHFSSIITACSFFAVRHLYSRGVILKPASRWLIVMIFDIAADQQELLFHTHTSQRPMQNIDNRDFRSTQEDGIQSPGFQSERVGKQRGEMAASPLYLTRGSVITKVINDNEPRRASDRSHKSWFLGDYQSARNSSNSGIAT